MHFPGRLFHASVEQGGVGEGLGVSGALVPSLTLLDRSLKMAILPEQCHDLNPSRVRYAGTGGCMGGTDSEVNRLASCSGMT